jgi:hypothetical protein
MEKSLDSESIHRETGHDLFLVDARLRQVTRQLVVCSTFSALQKFENPLQPERPTLALSTAYSRSTCGEVKGRRCQQSSVPSE